MRGWRRKMVTSWSADETSGFGKNRKERSDYDHSRKRGLFPPRSLPVQWTTVLYSTRQLTRQQRMGSFPNGMGVSAAIGRVQALCLAACAAVLLTCLTAGDDPGAGKYRASNGSSNPGSGSGNNGSVVPQTDLNTVTPATFVKDLRLKQVFYGLAYTVLYTF